MQSTTLLAATAAVGLLAHAATAATVTAAVDARYGFVSASNGGHPTYIDFDPGADGMLFQPVSFNECMLISTWTACMNLQSQFLNLGPGNTVTGFTASGWLNASKAADPGAVTATAYLKFSIVVSDVAPGQKIPFTWHVHFTNNDAVTSAAVDGPGTNIAVEGSGDWDDVLWLGPGQYDFNITVSAASETFPMYIGSVDFSVALEAAPAQCSPDAGSCYLVHPTGGCDDFACCNAVCAADPFCCGVTWDAPCVWSASDTCVSTFLTGDIPNPLNGHRYRLTKPLDWASTPDLLNSYGYLSTAISGGAENAWIRGNLAANVPGLPAFGPRIGLHDGTVEGVFAWQSGEPFLYANWAPGEPNGGAFVDSVQISGVTGRWSDVEGASPLPAIGELFAPACGAGGGGAGPCVTPHQLPGCNDESCCNEVCAADPYCCNQHWDATCAARAQVTCTGAVTGPTVVNPANGHRYVAVSGGSWLQAERLALSLGGHLAAIGDAAENAWLVQNFLALPGSPNELFIGMNDHAVEGAFRWVSHEPHGFSAWAPGEPNNYEGFEDVATLRATGEWNDIPSTLSRMALIEMPCVGDVDGDAFVGGADLAILLGAWGGPSEVADLSGDGLVDGADLAMLLGAWGPCPSSNACEPHAGTGSDQPGCTACVCGIDPFCCQTQWDWICADESGSVCDVACQCGG